MLTQENLDRMHTDDMKVSLVLFDEIEKASDSLWQLLLGILDKATLTLGDNRRVDFSKAMVIMTSNLGAREMSELISGGIGFAPGKGTKSPNDTEVDQKIYRTAVEAARRKFSPEFMNRIDKVVVFRSLKEHHLRQILDLESQAVQDRIMQSAGTKFVFQCSDTAKDMLMKEGIDYKVWCSSFEESGRTIPRTYPLFEPGRYGTNRSWVIWFMSTSTPVATVQRLKSSGGALIHEIASKDDQPESSSETLSGGVGLPIPQATKAAKKGHGRGEI